jgi:hypothetical protein
VGRSRPPGARSTSTWARSPANRRRTVPDVAVGAPYASRNCTAAGHPRRRGSG